MTEAEPTSEGFDIKKKNGTMENAQNMCRLITHLRHKTLEVLFPELLHIPRNWKQQEGTIYLIETERHWRGVTTPA
jgi:hypothetical protein